MPKGKMSTQQRIDWYDFQNNKSNTLTEIEFKLICTLHADLYAHKYYEPCTCSPKRIKEWIAQITRIYETRLNT